MLLLVVSMSANASSKSLPAEVHDAVESLLVQEWGEGNVQWVVNSVPGILHKTEGKTVRIECESYPRGTTLVQVTLGEEGKVVRRIPLSIRVMPFAWVPVATTKLDRHKALGRDNVVWERREVTTVRGTWPESDRELFSRNYWMRRNLRADTILTWANVEEIPEIIRGDKIAIVSRQGNVEVTTQGEAMQDGREGEMIRVRNSQYNSILEAQVEARGRVVLQGLIR